MSQISFASHDVCHLVHAKLYSHTTIAEYCLIPPLEISGLRSLYIVGKSDGYLKIKTSAQSF